VKGPAGIPSRHEQVRRLRSSDPSKPFDVLIIGGGATGAGAALDAATRGKGGEISVALIERGDFASETSSRSTKLLWAGIKYLAVAASGLLSWNLFTSPIQTAKNFIGEFKMVASCHRERKFMTEKQPHLTNWVPIVVPFTEWLVWPPPFGHWAFSLFPVLSPPTFKFYDSMSGFTCPPSYMMSKKEAGSLFPQLNEKKLKYAQVFYEAQHNDARTNIAIAMTAAQRGANIANYVEMTGVIHNADGKVTGVKAQDRISGEDFEIYAKNVVFAGGPFTDSMRKLEVGAEKGAAAPVPAVQGGSGTHIVLPGYYSPNGMGLLDFNTSDGRFLFFLPWQNHTLVGTTDSRSDAESLPNPPEDEIRWILNECEKYLSPDMHVRRSDVLSSWRGWRPLAVDPHAEPGAPASRDHVISYNAATGVTFIAGGKWTTWREMAEEVVDRILGEDRPECHTLDISLHGGEGYTPSLSIQLIQKFGLATEIAEHLAKTYGTRAWEVCDLCKPTGKSWPRYGVQFAPLFPYIEAEVVFACREYACTVEDVLSRRTRLAFLNKDAAVEAVPRVADIMAKELGWTNKTKKEQIEAAYKYLDSYGGRIPKDEGLNLRCRRDIEDVFHAIDTDGSGFLDEIELKEAATNLGLILNEKELDEVFVKMDKKKNGRIDKEEFISWWNELPSEVRNKYAEELRLGGSEPHHIKDMTLLG